MTKAEALAGRVLLISGVPGAGKTTVSRLLVRCFERAALIEGDEIHNLVVSGRLHPNEEPLDEADRQLMLRDRNIAALTDNLTAEGFLVIVDDVFVSRVRLRRLLGLMSARPLYLVTLAPDLDVARYRDARRGNKSVLHIWSHLDAMMRREIPGLGLWLDSSALSAEQTVAVLLERVWRQGRLDVDILAEVAV